MKDFEESMLENVEAWREIRLEAFALMYKIYKLAYEAGKFDKASLSATLNNEESSFRSEKEVRTLSYLGDIKTQVRQVFDEAFKEAWPLIEKAIKDSYKNGLNKAKQPSNDD